MIYKHKRILNICARQTVSAQLISIKYDDGSQLKIIGHPWARNKVHIYFDDNGQCSYVDVETIED